MPAEFAGRVALVTGVGRAGQIGHAVARGLGAAGARLVLAGRDPALLATHVRTFSGEGIEALPADGDLTDPVVARTAVQLAQERFGGLDVLVNLAGGYLGAGPVAEITAPAFDGAIAANLKTAFVVSQAAIPALRTRGGGAIVNFASIAAVRPGANMAVYAASKSGVVGLTRALARELRDAHIRVNAVAPGLVRTADNKAQMSGDPKARWVELDQIVAAVCYLAGPRADAVSGQVLAVTGGDG